MLCNSGYSAFNSACEALDSAQHDILYILMTSI